MVKSNSYPVVINKAFKSINGKEISLKLLIASNTVNVTIENTSLISIYNKSLCLLIVNLINLLCLYLNILNIWICTAIFVVSTILLIVFLGNVVEENIIVIKKLGYQFLTRHMLSRKHSFIPFNEVQEIFINEVIYQHKIMYVLTLLTKEERTNKDKLITLFRVPNLTKFFFHLSENDGRAWEMFLLVDYFRAIRVAVDFVIVYTRAYYSRIWGYLL